MPAVVAPVTTKNTAGYDLRPGIDYMDLFIGSEGTLGVVTEAELALLPAPRELFTGVIFFESDETALEAVGRWGPAAGLRVLEYLGAGSHGSHTLPRQS